jgi:glycosyltransferase involved in cell wall biosynthesis
MVPPTVSIVMPTMNRASLLASTVQSVFAQTFQDWELIIADDGSDACVVDYLLGLEQDRRVRVLRLTHSGNPGATRNAGIATARAPLIAFQDSDDLWEPQKLERQLEQMRAEPECRWSYSGFVVCDAEGIPYASERNRLWVPHRGHIFEQVVRTTASIRTPSVIVNTKLLKDVGGFDEAIDCSDDYDLWMRLALASPVGVVDEPLVRVRRHSHNLQRPLAAPYESRDYSLRKLARALTGADRQLVLEERSRNALALSAATYASGARWQSVVAVAKSLPFSWTYPRWWYGGTRAVARACTSPLDRPSCSGA